MRRGKFLQGGESMRPHACDSLTLLPLQRERRYSPGNVPE